jgi:hypothetical protein
MKYREGKINAKELFQKGYLDNGYEYERVLSPFWEEIQLFGKEKIYVNYLTGEFTQK